MEDNVADSLRGLSLTDRTSEARDSTSQSQSTLVGACRGVTEAAKVTIQRYQSVNASINTIHNGDDVDILRLHRDAKRLGKSTERLAESTKKLVNAAEREIVDRVIELGGPCQRPIPALLRHFDQEIMAIARTVLGADADGDCAMWKIAEECYNEATTDSGRLDVDHYFVPLEEARLGYPYDADFEERGVLRARGPSRP
ncbi:hypothetical protein IMZ48_06810 [Candidatus Bathyarchaeota archaeon]|nr:hypothetical protein [Candidatus Bathyarchaeota archaeon]